MKYLETKHERNSAKITGLIILIIGLLLFVVGAPYKEIPDEYGVAINFGEPSEISDSKAFDNPTKSDSNTEDIEKEVSPEQQVEDEEIDDIAETVPEEEVEDNSEDEAQEQLEQEQAEQKATEEAAKAEAAKLEAAKQEEAREEAAKQKAAEELLAQQEEEALRIKEAKEKAEAERLEKERKEKIEAKRIADAKAKKEQEAEAERDRARKAEADRIAKAKAAKAAREKAEREAAAKAERERLAKAKAAREAKERADMAAAAKASKAEADRKAAAAAAAEKNKSGGSDNSGFKLSQQGPIYPGCEGKNNADRKVCMNQKISSFFGRNFDKELAATLGFSSDQTIKIYFKISKTGQIIDIRAKAAHPKLEQETQRVINMLPKIKPAMQQGQPTTAPYSTLVRFKAE